MGGKSDIGSMLSLGSLGSLDDIAGRSRLLLGVVGTFRDATGRKKRRPQKQDSNNFTELLY